MNERRAAESRPNAGRDVESSESIRATAAVMTAARIISGEAELADVFHLEPGEPLKARTHEIAGALAAILAPVKEVLDRLERDVAGLGRDPLEADSMVDEIDPAEQRVLLTPEGVAAAEVPPVPRCKKGAIGPYRCVLAAGHDGPHESADGPSWIDGESVPPVLLGVDGVRVLSIADAEYTRAQLDRVERARAILGGTPLDLSARLLNDVERHAGQAAEDGDRIALVTHLEGTCAALLAGTTRHVRGHDHEGVRDDLARANRTIQRLREEIADTRTRERNAREREAERTKERDEWQRLAEEGQAKLEAMIGKVVAIGCKEFEAGGRAAGA